MLKSYLDRRKQGPKSNQFPKLFTGGPHFGFYRLENLLSAASTKPVLTIAQGKRSIANEDYNIPGCARYVSETALRLTKI